MRQAGSSKRALEDPDGRLAATLPGVLAQLRAGTRKAYDELLEEMRSVDEARPILATYISRRVYSNFTDDEADLLRQFLADESMEVVRIALSGLTGLSDKDPTLTRELALSVAAKLRYIVRIGEIDLSENIALDCANTEPEDGCIENEVVVLAEPRGHLEGSRGTSSVGERKQAAIQSSSLCRSSNALRTDLPAS